MPKLKRIKHHTSQIKDQTARQFLKLSTGSLGLVAALAWNEFIKEVVNNYIKPYVGGSSGVISLFIYATIVTIIAVFVTYTLSGIIRRS